MPDKKRDRSGANDKAGLQKRFAKLGAARRAARRTKPTAATKSVGERIAKLAGESGMVVEWTLRPQDTSESVGIGCFCGCGCSCIA